MDGADRRIAVVPKAGALPFNERQANLALITAAPELLAALLEAAYTLDCAGTPLNPSFYDLINRCRVGTQPLYPRSRNPQ